MEDRKVMALAALIGGVAVGGFWMARPTPGRVPLRVVEQKAVGPHGVGEDTDAAVVFRLRLPALVRDSQGEQNLFFCLTDRTGKVYPLLPMVDPLLRGSFKLLRGYGSVLESPRIEARLGGTMLASCAIESLPPPTKIDLTPTPKPPLSLVYRGGDALWVEYRRPVPPGERWRIVARRTDRVDRLHAPGQPAPFRGPGGVERLMIPYPGEAKQVEVDVRRFRLERKTIDITVPNLRIVRRFGTAALVVDRTFRVPNPLGLSIVVPQQELGAKRPVKRDLRVLSATIALSTLWPYAEDSASFSRRSPGPTVEILSPAPESLGLRELRIGGGSRLARVEPQGPVKLGVFEAKLRVTYSRPVFMDQRRAVISVRTEPPRRMDF